jgi:hypothetical protein
VEKIILNPEARRIIIEICVTAKLRALEKERQAKEKVKNTEFDCRFEENV